MKAKELRTLVTPKYFYSKNIKSDNKSLKTLEKGFKWNNLPNNLLAHFNKRFRFNNIYEETKKNNFIHAEEKDFFLWKKYKSLIKINEKYTFIEYKELIKKNSIKKGIIKNENLLYNIKRKFNKFNEEFNIRKKILWIFQKMFIFFKSIKTIGKKYSGNLNIENILVYCSKIKKIYKNIFFILIKFFSSFIYRFSYYKKIKWMTHVKKIKLKFGLYFFLIFLTHFKRKFRVLPQITKNVTMDTTTSSIDNEEEENFNNMGLWMNIIDNKPWMTFKDTREFNKKKDYYLDINFNKKQRKKLLDWLCVTEKRFKAVRVEHKQKKLKNLNTKKKW